VCDSERIVDRKEAELVEVGEAIGPIEFMTRQKAITRALLSKTSNLKEKEGTEKAGKMMISHNYNRSPNVQEEKITSEDIPPRLLCASWGTFPTRPWASKPTSLSS